MHRNIAISNVKKIVVSYKIDVIYDHWSCGNMKLHIYHLSKKIYIYIQKYGIPISRVLFMLKLRSIENLH